MVAEGYILLNERRNAASSGIGVLKTTRAMLWTEMLKVGNIGIIFYYLYLSCDYFYLDFIDRTSVLAYATTLVLYLD